MKVMGILGNTVLAAAFTAGVMLLGAAAPSMAASQKDQRAWDHYQTRTYKGGSRTEWYLRSFTNPITGNIHRFLKMEFYDAKGKLRTTKFGLVGAVAQDGDSRKADWDAALNFLKKEGGKLRITPEFAKIPLGKYLTAKGAGLVTVDQPGDGGRPVSTR